MKKVLIKRRKEKNKMKILNNNLKNHLTYIFLFAICFFATENLWASPIPDIIANNSNSSINLNAGNNLFVTFSLTAGTEQGKNADWWMVADTPFGWYYFNANFGWSPGINSTYQKPLSNTSPFTVLNYNGLPEGTYRFYFGVDLEANGEITMDRLYYDYIVVQIASSSGGGDSGNSGGSNDSGNSGGGSSGGGSGDSNDGSGDNGDSGNGSSGDSTGDSSDGYDNSGDNNDGNSNEGSDNSGNNNSDSGSNDDNSSDSLPSCGSETALFTNSPLDSDAFDDIRPLGAMNPPGHTFPTVHTYMILADKTTVRPVYSPGDITIWDVRYAENDGFREYHIGFKACAEVAGYFKHITGLSEDILNEIGEFSSCYETPDGDTECAKVVDIKVSAGTVIGDAGSSTYTAAAAIDFGLRDERIDPLDYINPDRLISHNQVYTVCPYEYYPEGTVKDLFFERLGLYRTSGYLCGKIDYDVAGTASGLWYLEGSEHDYKENDHIALAPSSKDPESTGLLSVGNSSVGTDAYFFDYLSSGFVNRSFEDVVFDGNIYCYDNLRDWDPVWADPLDGYLFLQMTGESNLIIERVSESASCPSDPNTLSFSDAAVEFER